MNETITALVQRTADEAGLDFTEACAVTIKAIKAAHNDYINGSECEAPKLKSGSRVILAADAALAAVEVYCSQERENEDWEAVARIKRAALESALASISG